MIFLGACQGPTPMAVPDMLEHPTSPPSESSTKPSDADSADAEPTDDQSSDAAPPTADAPTLPPEAAAGCDLLLAAEREEAEIAQGSEGGAADSGYFGPALLTLVAGGDLWLWHDGEPEARKVALGDVVDAWPSPDGQVVAVLRANPAGEYYALRSIWRLDADGGGLRELVTAAQLEADLGDTGEVARVYQVQWRPATRELNWRVSPHSVDGFGGPIPTLIRRLEVDSGELGAFPFEVSQGSFFSWSPDGAWSVDVVGSMLIRDREGNTHFEESPGGVSIGMGHGFWGIAPQWSRDSRRIAQLVPMEEPASAGLFGSPVRFKDFEVSVEDARSRVRAEITATLAIGGDPFSSDLRLIVHPAAGTEHDRPPGASENQLRIADLDGTWRDYLQGVVFGAWAPQGWAYLYRIEKSDQIMVGRPCAAPVVVSETPGARTRREMAWIDAERFVFLDGLGDEELIVLRLRLGHVDGSSQVLASFPEVGPRVLRVNR